MKRGFSSSWRIAAAAAAVLLAFGAIGARLVHLQVVRQAELAAQVERARKRVQVVAAARGEIRDATGSIFATNRTMIEVGVDPQSAVPDDASRLPELARLLGLPAAEVAAACARKTAASADGRGVREVRWVRLAEAIEEPAYRKVQALRIKGVYGNRQYRRAYPMGSLAAHVVGFVNREGAAAMGIESRLDYYLRGQDGWVESERDGRRQELAQFRSREVPPVDGYHVVLSIDAFVQDCIERELREVVRRFNPLGASIIVSDPRTGFILGLANHPAFNLNEFNRAEIAAQRNIAITDFFEPGSTFKIVAASAALDQGLVSEQTAFDCGSDVLHHGGRAIRLPRDSHENGVLTVADIVAKSSNRGAASLGVLLGADRLHDYAAAFGFGEVSGLALGGEVPGMLHPVKNWDGLTISRLPMGHAVGATPLQIHFAMSAIAAEGRLMRPQVVSRIVDGAGVPVFEFGPVERRRVVRPETARRMAALLQRVAAPGGTAPKAALPGFEVAGKTGTTQKIIDGRYSNTHHVGSFAGFLPASRPQLVISVFIDDARMGGTAYGATVAAPSFKTIAEQLVQYRGISPTRPAEAGAGLAASAPKLPASRDRIR
jgi:cell division protein FtsI (penicillin-binding protein 3)/stage V sporulation protein D (sporulation-specific penicillin-binding protein)